MFNKEMFRKFLKEKREAMGISQREVDRRLNCVRGICYQWENGIRTPIVESMLELSRLLKFSMGELDKMYIENEVTIKKEKR